MQTETEYNMTRNNNETRKKANAVFFSVIMVVSMVAIGFAGFAGGGAAIDSDPVSGPVDDLDITEGDGQEQTIEFTFSPDTLDDSNTDQQFEIVVTGVGDLEASADPDITLEDQSGNTADQGDGTVDTSHDGNLEADNNDAGFQINADSGEAGDLDVTEEIDVTVTLTVDNAGGETVQEDVAYAINDIQEFDDFDTSEAQFDITNDGLTEDDVPSLNADAANIDAGQNTQDQTVDIDADFTALLGSGTNEIVIDVSDGINSDVSYDSFEDESEADAGNVRITEIDVEGASPALGSVDTDFDDVTRELTIGFGDEIQDASSIDTLEITLFNLDTSNADGASDVEYGVASSFDGSDDPSDTALFDIEPVDDVEDADADYADFDGDVIDVIFQGQDVYVVGDAIQDNEGETVNLRQVDSFDDNQVESSSQIEQLEVEDIADLDINTDDGVFEDFDQAVEISTDDLDADDYFIRGLDGLPSNPAEEDTFEVTIQDLDVEFDDEEVTDGGPDSTTDLDIDSDRGTYSVNASADGDLDEDELLEVFVNQNVGDGALIDLHMTDAVREEVTFDEADRVLIDDQRPGRDLGEFTDTELADIFEAGLVELELEADEVDALNDDLEAVLDSPTTPIVDGAGESVEIQEDDEFVEAFGIANPFNAFAFAEAEDDEDEQVVLIGLNDREEEVDFTDVDDDTYEFDFNASDTEAADTASIEVREEDQDGTFVPGVTEAGAGDIVEFELELEDTDEAFIQIGDEDAGYVDVILVEDDGEPDDAVAFQMNTRLAGTSAATDEVYHSENDEIHASAVHDGFDALDDAASDEANYDGPIFVDDDDDVLTGGTNQFTVYLEELDLIDDEDTEDGQDQLVRPLQPASYDVTAGVNDGNDGVFQEDDGVSSAQNELDSALMELTTPDIGEVITHVAPSDSADEDDDLDDLLDVVTPREDVALDDRLVVQVEATGLYGAMVALEDDGDDFDILEDGTSGNTIHEVIDIDGEGIEIDIEAQDAVGNQDPTAVQFEDADEDEVFVIIGEEQEQFFIIVDTDEDDAFENGDPDDGDIFDATIEYETDDDDRYEFFDSDASNGAFSGGADGDATEAAYPFFQADSDITVTTSFTFEDAAADFDNLSEDGDVQVVPEEEAEVSGETNVAPGTDASVRLRSTGDTSPSFVVTEDADIEGDGAFAATFDLSAQEEGDTANAIFRADGDQIDTQGAVFVDAIEEDVDTPTPTPEEEDTPTPEEEDTPTPDEDTPTPDDTDDDTPGFGAVVALVALIAAALLATRRRTQS